MSLEYSITRGVGKSRGRWKTRVVSPIIGQAGCPGWEQDCLKPAGTWVGVRTHMYKESNSLGDFEVRGSEGRHAGTGEGISARTHVANSHADRAEYGRRSDRRHSENSSWKRSDSCMTVGASIVIAYPGALIMCVSQYRSEGFNQGWKLIRIKKRKARAYSKRGRHPTHHTHWSLNQLGFLSRAN